MLQKNMLAKPWHWSRRFLHRLLAHHLPLFIASAIAFACLYCTRPYPDPVTRSSFATAYPALVLLAITLLIGPWNILRKNRNPVSTDLRRDIGIWAGILGVLHTVIGQNVHLRGRPWLYYVYEKWGHHILPIRQDWFGLANYTGAISALLLIALLATSSDYALRSFGTPRWKQLQRWNYAVFALAAVHAVTYQANEKLHLRFILVVRLCIGVAVFIQLAGFFYRRHAAKFS